MTVTGTHIAYYHTCHRKLWLFANGIQMEHTSDVVYEGKLIHENSYPQRSVKYTEIALDGIKIDHYDPQEKVVHEVKKSNKVKEAHYWQLKYYLYVLKRHGVEATGVLEYPTLRKKEKVNLTEQDEAKIEAMLIRINELLLQGACPEREKKSICRKCSYFDFCWSEELSYPITSE